MVIKIIVLIFVQVVLGVCIGLLAQFGILDNAGGSLSIASLIASLIAAIGIDFLVIRHLFWGRKRPQEDEDMQPPVSPDWQYRPVPPMPPKNLHEYGEGTVVMDEPVVQEARIIYYENGLVRRIQIQNGKFLIGKQQGQVNLVLSSPRVSRVHAQICRQYGVYVVMDCDSKNGTYINGSKKRLASNVPYQLHNGDVIRVADVELTFEC